MSVSPAANTTVGTNIKNPVIYTPALSANYPYAKQNLYTIPPNTASNMYDSFSSYTLPTSVDTQLTSRSKFDYSADDGKISFKDKIKNFGKGLISPITNMFSSPKNLLLSAGAIVLGAGLIIATGGAAAPILVAAGVTGGAIQFGVSAYKASNAESDAEAEAAWQGMGAGTGAVAGSILGSKAAAKGAGLVSNGEKAGFLSATAKCFKSTPSQFAKSINTFKTGEALANVQNALHIKTKVNTAEQTPADADTRKIEIQEQNSSTKPAEQQVSKNDDIIDDMAVKTESKPADTPDAKINADTDTRKIEILEQSPQRTEEILTEDGSAKVKQPVKTDVADDIDNTIVQKKKLASNSETLKADLQKAIDESQAGCKDTPLGKLGTNNHSTEAYLDTIEQGGFKVKKVVAVGGESAVFELDDGSILKLSPEKYPITKGNDFYAPEIQRGTIEMQNYHTGVNDEPVNQINYIIQEKGDVNVSQADIDAFIKSIGDKGYKMSDYREDQFAYFTDSTGNKIVKTIDIGAMGGRTTEYNAYKQVSELSSTPVSELETGRFSKMAYPIRDMITKGETLYNQDKINTVNQTASEIAKFAKQTALDENISLLEAINRGLKQHGYDTIRTFD